MSHILRETLLVVLNQPLLNFSKFKPEGFLFLQASYSFFYFRWEFLDWKVPVGPGKSRVAEPLVSRNLTQLA